MIRTSYVNNERTNDDIPELLARDVSIQFKVIKKEKLNFKREKIEMGT